MTGDKAHGYLDFFRPSKIIVKVAHVILVTGATGNAGVEAARALAAAGHPVRALTRDPSSARLPAGVTAAQGDLTSPRPWTAPSTT